MHEMSLAESILQIVEATAAKENATQVTEVVLEIGALASVETAALRFAFEVVKRNSVAATARLEIARIPGEGWCLPCGQRVPLSGLGDLCPCCGSAQVQPTHGTDMRVKEIVLADHSTAR